MCVIAVRCVLWFNENILMMVYVCACVFNLNLNQKRVSVITNSAARAAHALVCGSDFTPVFLSESNRGGGRVCMDMTAIVLNTMCICD